MTNSPAESGTKRKRAPAPAERSRDRIMAAAAELARERGVSGATIAMVCQRSGLPVSSVYWYFEDKDQLFAEVIRTSFATWLVSVPRWDVSADTTIASGLRRVLGESVRTFADMPSFLRIGMQVLLETGEQHQKTRQAYIDVREQTRRMMTAWMTALLPDEVSGAVAEDLASLVIALSDGMSVGSQIYPDWQPDEYVELIASTIDAVVTTQRRR
jgi:AcrR family transcriptional regulator